MDRDDIAREDIRQLLARLDHIENGLYETNPSGYTRWNPAAGANPANPASAAAGSGGVPADVVALVQSGKKIAAIARYRELTGVGLREAKSVIDRL